MLCYYKKRALELTIYFPVYYCYDINWCKTQSSFMKIFIILFCQLIPKNLIEASDIISKFTKKFFCEFKLLPICACKTKNSNFRASVINWDLFLMCSIFPKFFFGLLKILHIRSIQFYSNSNEIFHTQPSLLYAEKIALKDSVKSCIKICKTCSKFG